MALSDTNVRSLAAADAGRWSAFVDGQPVANLYHTLAWRDVIEAVFGHRAHYLLAEREGRVVGVLPLFRVRMPLLGSKLISLPYDIGSGGALAADEPAERALIERAVALARERRVDFLELRCARAHAVPESLGFRRSEPVLLSEMELDGEATVWGRVSRDHRKAMRKAVTRGVAVRETDRPEDFERFYRVYLRAFRAFGTPPYPARYFPALHRHLSATRSVRLLLAEVDGRCVGGLLLFCRGPNWVSKFAACLPEAVSLRTYPLLYGRAIELGLAAGCRRLGWGSSARSQTGLIEFKDRWGSRTWPAAVYGLPLRGSLPSLERYYDSEGIRQRVWRRLPLAATRVLGGPINRWFC